MELFGFINELVFNFISMRRNQLHILHLISEGTIIKMTTMLSLKLGYFLITINTF